MKYRVIYRLKHPQFLPTTSRVVVDAHTHAELSARLASIRMKWQAQGYTIRIMKVIQGTAHG